MNDLELIIFDCDGVLVDSERIANDVFAKILKEECGLSFTLEEMFRIFVGHSAKQCMAIITELLGEEPPLQLEERYKAEIDQVLSASVTAISGIENALNSLLIPYCVASSGSHEKMQTTLGKTKLLKYFEGSLYSSADVERGKPYPDVYLYAAKQMGNFDPAKCLVIEDSPLGVQGGVAAGMTVFGYAELMSERRLVDAGAHHTFNSMNNLQREIETFSRTAAPQS